MKLDFRHICFFCFLVSTLLLPGCISKKQLIYFPNESFNTKEITSINNKPPSYRLQPRDVLSIRIKTLDNETSDYFNIQPDGGFQAWNSAQLYLTSYSIDDGGNIMLPEVGKISVQNLTIDEAQRQIQEKVAGFIKNATILVKMVSYKITVLGEVKTPGYYYIYNDQITLLEALGQAGDLTDYGNRENITLVRQVQGGSQVILVNLKDPNLIASPYYYLLPNDVLYVQPLKAKATRANLNALTALSVFFGAVSTAVLLIQFLR